ncbi:MAG: hypothetical protein A2252_07795 [Elusimicrobia bacterium RIFOXYA2_FULL_39_19]|nr:MAG: hypothetical protein A2252_07795 [Elusimicrobia bacterium RIFOXYA2_FULL_39_19]
MKKNEPNGKFTFVLNKMIQVFIVLLFTYTLTTNHCLFASPWKAFQNDAQRTGVANDVALPELSLNWSYINASAGIMSSPVIHDGKVFFGDRHGYLRVLNLTTGEELWNYSASDWIDASPVINNGYVYVASRDGNVYKLKTNPDDIESPEPEWVYDTESNLCSSPAIYNNKLYILSGHPIGEILEIDINTGLLTNSFNVPSSGFSSPAVKDHYLVVGTNTGKYFCIDTNNFTEKWNLQAVSNLQYTSPVISDDNKVYMTSRGHSTIVYCKDLVTGNALWESVDIADTYLKIDPNSGPYTTSSSLSLDDGKLYVAYAFPYYEWNGGGWWDSLGDRVKLVCLNAATGDVLWVSSVLGEPDSSGLISSPSKSGDVIYIGSADTYLYAVNASTGGIINRYVSNGKIVGTPAISNDAVYFGTLSGGFYCYSSSNVAYISAPADYAMVYGTVAVTGSANMSDFSNYILQYRNDSGGSWSIITTSAQQKLSEMLGIWDAANIVDSTYTLKLILNKTGGTSYYALATAWVNNPPKVPASLVAVNITNSTTAPRISLTFTKSDDESTGSADVYAYRIYRSQISGNTGSLVTTVPAGSYSYIDTSISYGVTYYYTVKAYDNVWESSGSVQSWACPLDGIIPTAPLTFSYSVINGNILLLWEKSVDDGTGINDVSEYQIFRSTISGGYVSAYQSVVKGTTHYLDTDIDVLSTYYYILKAVDGGHNLSNPCPEVSTMLGLPGPAMNFTGNVFGLRANLNWEKSIDDGAIKNNVSAYVVYRSSENNTNYSELVVLGAGTTTYQDTAITNNVSYFYKVRVRDSRNNYSTESNVVELIIPATNAPELQNGYITRGNIMLLWNLSADDGQGLNVVSQYHVYRSTVSTVYSDTPYVVLPQGTTHYLFADTQSLIRYYYTIKVFDTYGKLSSYSNEVTALVPLPVAPLNLTASAIQNYIALSWEKSADEDNVSGSVVSYELYRSTFTGGGFAIIKTLSFGTTYYDDRETIINTDYFYTIRSVDKSGNYSDWSAQAKTRIVSKTVDVDVAKKEEVVMQTDVGEITIVFEPNSISQNDTLSITRVTKETYPERGTALLDHIWKLTFSKPDTVLTKQVTINFPYSDTEITDAKIFSENLLRIFRFDENKRIWKMSNASRVVPDKKQVEMTTDRFSVFSIGAYKYSGKLLEKKEVYVYPSPAKRTDKVYFKYKLYDVFETVDINIKVYSITDQLIWENTATYTDQDAGKTFTTQWNISNIASGVYIFKVEAKSGNFKETYTKKLAVIQ